MIKSDRLLPAAGFFNFKTQLKITTLIKYSQDCNNKWFKFYYVVVNYT